MLPVTMQINCSVGLGEPTTALPVPFLIDAKTSQFAQDFSRPSGDPSEPASADAPTVLLVDDNEMTLARAKSVLSAGCVVVGTARNAHAALEAAAALNPDVVVLDISMPGINGFELARRLRAAGSTAQLVFLTVHEEDELILAARNVGAIGYVVKTRLASDLKLAVREARAGRPFQSPVRS
jgi:DNA-binding NarL/FixJ family response regulator